MRPGGGKQKGAAFEREVCKRLSLFMTSGGSTDVFWRSAMSGGRATLEARKGKAAARQAGDITATAPEGHKLTGTYYLECKSYRSLDVHHFVLGFDRGKLNDFWVRAKAEAAQHELKPMLIAKQNNIKPLVILPFEHDTWLTRRVMPLCWVQVHDAVLFWFNDLFPTWETPRARNRNK